MRQEALDGASESTTTRSTAVTHALALLLCIGLPYANAIPNGFVWDDNDQIDTHVPQHLQLTRILTEPSWMALQGSQDFHEQTIRTYRPLLLLSFVADAALWGGRAWGYHLTNLVLFALFGVALLAVLRALIASEWAALTFAAVFCTQPALSESVSWISGRHDLLLALLLTTSTLCLCRAAHRVRWQRRALQACGLLAFVLALMSKEPACLFPLALWVLLWLSPLGQRFSRVERWVLLIAYALLASVYLGYRSSMIARGNLIGGSLGAWAVLQAAPMVATKYLGYFIYLPHLSSHYFQPRVTGFGLSTFWLPLLCHAALLCSAFLLRRRHWGLLFGLVVYYALLAPSVVMIANKPEYSLRFLFLPSLGLMTVVSVLAAGLYRSGSPRARRACIVVAVLLVATDAARIHLRNLDYQSDWTFYSSIIRDVPDSPLGYYGLGIWSQKHGLRDQAVLAYATALVHGPELASAYNNLGVLLLQSGRFEQAKSVLERGIVKVPRHARLYYNLGSVYGALGDVREEERYLARAIELDPTYRKAYRRLYALYLTIDEQRAQAFRARYARQL